MTAPTSGRDDATLRGAIVLVVAIVIGLALLARSGGGGDDEDAARTDRTTESAESSSTTAAGGTETTVPIQGSTTTESTLPTGGTQDPAGLLVVVLNATGQVGWASENAGVLSSASYQTAEGNLASGENVDTSTIYAVPEAMADAQAVATLVDLGDAPVTEKPAEPLGNLGEDAEADVVVVLGADSLADG